MSDNFVTRPEFNAFVVETREGFERLDAKIDKGFGEVRRAIDGHRPDVKGWINVAATIAIMLAGIGAAYVGGVKAVSDGNDEAHERRLERADDTRDKLMMMLGAELERQNMTIGDLK